MFEMISKNYNRRLPQYLVCAIVLCAGCGGKTNTQTASMPAEKGTTTAASLVEKPPSSATVAGTAPAVSLDPKAQALVTEMLKAYRGLKSYSDSTSIRFVKGKPDSAINATVAYQAPAKIAVIDQAKDGKTIRISDGTTYYRQSPNPEKEFLKEPVLQQYGREALMQQMPAGSVFSGILLGVDPFKAPWGYTPRTLVLAEPGEINGEPVDILVAQFIQNGERELVSYQISQKDRLLRRIVVTTFNPDGGKDIMVETHSNVRVDPTLAASTFVYAPASDWKAVTRLQPPTWSDKLQVGGAPAPIRAVDTAGRAIDLDQYKGKATLIMFWASWCHFCKKEMPHVLEASRKYKDKGLEIIGVSLDSDKNDLKKYVEENKVPWRQICDEKKWGGEVARQYGIRSIPFAVLIGKDGKIAALNMSRLQFDAALASELGSGPKSKVVSATSVASDGPSVPGDKPASKCRDCGGV